jgi:putative nucleotidyltransferase with HDIG domain
VANDAFALLDRVEDLPPLPAVAARVMGMADDERTSALDLAQVLSTDQALTAKLIKLSNSAYYGFARRVSTVREAVLVLGFKQVRQVAVGASIINAWKGPREADDHFDLDLFWGHSVAVAVIAESFAKKGRFAKPEDAFTAGILHDIGRLVLRQALPREFRMAVSMAKSRGLPLHVTELRTTGYLHDEIGRALGERWKFPPHLVEAIACHHDEKVAPAADGLSGVIAYANQYALHHGLYCGYDVDGGGEVEPLPAHLASVDAAVGDIERVLERAFYFIEAASGTPEKRHTLAS